MTDFHRADSTVFVVVCPSRATLGRLPKSLRHVCQSFHPTKRGQTTSRSRMALSRLFSLPLTCCAISGCCFPEQPPTAMAFETSHFYRNRPRSEGRSGAAQSNAKCFMALSQEQKLSIIFRAQCQGWNLRPCLEPKCNVQQKRYDTSVKLHIWHWGPFGPFKQLQTY